MYEFFDISNKLEVVPEPEGCRYFDCIGGLKEKRYYIAPENVSRGEFLEKNEHLLDECLMPVYKHNGICIRQDPSFPIPGFYILSPIVHYKALDEMDPLLNSRLFFLLYHTRKGMREELGIEFINIYYEEKPKRSCNVHFILLPIYAEPYPRLYDLDLNAYLSQYEFLYSKYKDIIIVHNQKMRDYFKRIRLGEQDDLFKDGYQSTTRPTLAI